jgi:hypothetical protein
MIDRTARRFGITPRHLAADSAYGSAANLAWLVKEKQIEPHIPVFDKSNRTDGTFSRSDFVFDAERNHYTCPQGKLLVQFRPIFATPRSGITKGRARASPRTVLADGENYNALRESNPHQAFGNGPHHCAGAHSSRATVGTIEARHLRCRAWFAKWCANFVGGSRTLHRWRIRRRAIRSARRARSNAVGARRL